MQLTDLIGQKKNALFLQKIVENKKVQPQSYLFYGPPHSGKETFAIHFFKALNCSFSIDGFCNTCHNCYTIDHFFSPDIHPLFSFIEKENYDFFLRCYLKEKTVFWENLLKKEIYKLYLFFYAHPGKKKYAEKAKEFYESSWDPKTGEELKTFLESIQNELYHKIPIETIRQNMEKIYLSPYELHKKLLLINNASGLETDGSNILLKTIEEPPSHLIIIILANKKEDVLPTIQSRCIKLRFSPYSEKEKTLILKQTGIAIREILPDFSHFSLSCDIDSFSEKQTLAYIDFLKKYISSLGVLGEEKNYYLDSLKKGLLFYNISLKNIKEALKIFRIKYVKNKDY